MKAISWMLALVSLPWIAPNIIALIIITNFTFFLSRYDLVGYLMAAGWIVAAVIAMICAVKALGKKETLKHE